LRKEGKKKKKIDERQPGEHQRKCHQWLNS